MDTLQADMLQIARLEDDLHAETVIQEEVSHTELRRYHAGDGGTSVDQSIIEEEKEVIDQEQVAVPDPQRQEAARAQLLEISTTSHWYAARYKASRVLGKSREQLLPMLEIWIPEIKMRLANAPDECDLPGDLNDLCILSGSLEVESLLKEWEKGRKLSAAPEKTEEERSGHSAFQVLWRKIRSLIQ